MSYRILPTRDFGVRMPLGKEEVADERRFIRRAPLTRPNATRMALWETPLKNFAAGWVEYFLLLTGELKARER